MGFNFTSIKEVVPIVTLSAIGIAFNAGARRLLGNPVSIDIGYDEKQNAIGVMPHNGKSNSSTYRFEERMKDGWVRVGAKGFMKYISRRIGFDFKTKAIQFMPLYVEKDKMLVVIVDKEHMRTQKEE
jgi:hypothetical protein